MIPNFVLSIPVCPLNLKKTPTCDKYDKRISRGRKMSKSKYDNRRHSIFFAEDCSSTRRKSPRQPLHCKKNIFDVNRSKRNSKNDREACPIKIMGLSKIPQQKPSKTLVVRQRLSLGVETETVNTRSKQEFLKSRKQPLRSSRRNVTSPSKEAAVVRKNLSEHKSQRKQTISDSLVTINELSKPSKRLRSSGTVKTDALSKRSEQEFPKTSKRVLRSSTGHNAALQLKEVTIVHKNLSDRKSLRKQTISAKKTPEISQTVPPESLNKSKRPSLYRNKFISHDQQNLGLKEHPPETAVVQTPLPPKPRKEKRGSMIHSMILRSADFIEKKSDDVELPRAQKSKHVKCFTSTPKKQNTHEQRTKVVRKLRKSLPSVVSQDSLFTLKKSKCVRKPKKSQKFMRPKSFPGNIPIDDLALSRNKTRKTKSEGFKISARNTLKRKRFMINLMKEADEEYEDDIYESKKFDNFRTLFPDTSGSEMSYAATTPKLGFQLTPLIRDKTPVYRDCFSPTEYAMSRKVAEECFYRNKKRKSNPEKEMAEVPVPEKKKLEFNQVLENVCKAQKVAEELAEQKSDAEDSYFNDSDIQ